MATHEECQAAGNAVGWNVSASTVDAALAEFGEYSLEELRTALKENEAVFEGRQFRDSAELADEIDQQRIVVAVLEFRETHG